MRCPPSVISSWCTSATPSRRSPKPTPAPPGNCSTRSWRATPRRWGVHELDVAQALDEQVESVIDQHQASHAALIRVRIGPLAGVVPELLGSAFPLAAAGSRMEHAVLDLVAAPVRVHGQPCGACGDWHTQIVSGDELLLESVDLETVPTRPLTPHNSPLTTYPKCVTPA